MSQASCQAEWIQGRAGTAGTATTCSLQAMSTRASSLILILQSCKPKCERPPAIPHIPAQGASSPKAEKGAPTTTAGLGATFRTRRPLLHIHSCVRHSLGGVRRHPPLQCRGITTPAPPTPVLCSTGIFGGPAPPFKAAGRRRRPAPPSQYLSAFLPVFTALPPSTWRCARQRGCRRLSSAASSPTRDLPPLESNRDTLIFNRSSRQQRSRGSRARTPPGPPPTGAGGRILRPRLRDARRRERGRRQARPRAGRGSGRGAGGREWEWRLERGRA